VIKAMGRNVNGEQVLLQTISVPGKPTFYRAMIWRHCGEVEFGPTRHTEQEGNKDVQFHLTAKESSLMHSIVYNAMTDSKYPVV
jgi:hypothetical protein